MRDACKDIKSQTAHYSANISQPHSAVYKTGALFLFYRWQQI